MSFYSCRSYCILSEITLFLPLVTVARASPSHGHHLDLFNYICEPIGQSDVCFKRQCLFQIFSKCIILSETLNVCIFLVALLLHGVFKYRHFVQVFRCPDCSASQQMAVSLYPQSMTWTWPSSERPSRVLRNQALVTAHVAPLLTTHTSCQPPGLAARA